MYRNTYQVKSYISHNQIGTSKVRKFEAIVYKGDVIYAQAAEFPHEEDARQWSLDQLDGLDRETDIQRDW